MSRIFSLDMSSDMSTFFYRRQFIIYRPGHELIDSYTLISYV